MPEEEINAFLGHGYADKTHVWFSYYFFSAIAVSRIFRSTFMNRLSSHKKRHLLPASIISQKRPADVTTRLFLRLGEGGEKNGQNSI